jgi:hypothetical protein
MDKWYLPRLIEIEKHIKMRKKRTPTVKVHKG